MDEAHTLIAEIEDYCRRGGCAESTFGRLAVNDGKFVGRIRSGGPRHDTHHGARAGVHAGTVGAWIRWKRA